MSIEIQYEIQLLAASLAVGIWLMAAYDGLRLFRLSVRHNHLWTNIEDGCYWICSGIVTFLLLFEQNDGVLRGYAILGVLAGMLLYNAGVSRNIFKLLKNLRKYFTMRRTGKKAVNGRPSECVKTEEYGRKRKRT